MSNTVTGKVEAISAKPRGNGTAYGIKMSDGNWYGHGFTAPVFAKGDSISFSWDANGAFKNIDISTVTKEQQQQAPVQSSGGKSSGGYNDTQISIQYQSSRKDAIEVIGVALAHDALPLPTKKSDRYDAIVAAVNDLTGVFYADVSKTVANGGVVLEELEQAVERDGGWE